MFPTVVAVTRETGPQGTWEVSTIRDQRGVLDTVAFRVDAEGNRSDQAYPYATHEDARFAVATGTLRKLLPCVCSDEDGCLLDMHTHVYPDVTPAE